jgi:hypothetical protein
MTRYIDPFSLVDANSSKVNGDIENKDIENCKLTILSRSYQFPFSTVCAALDILNGLYIGYQEVVGSDNLLTVQMPAPKCRKDVELRLKMNSRAFFTAQVKMLHSQSCAPLKKINEEFDALLFILDFLPRVDSSKVQ